MNEDKPTYIGRMPCGCVMAMLAPDGMPRAATAKKLAEWVRDGMTIENKTVSWVREHGFEKCEMHRGKPQQQHMFGRR